MSHCSQNFWVKNLLVLLDIYPAINTPAVGIKAQTERTQSNFTTQLMTAVLLGLIQKASHNCKQYIGLEIIDETKVPQTHRLHQGLIGWASLVLSHFKSFSASKLSPFSTSSCHIDLFARKVHVSGIFIGFSGSSPGIPGECGWQPNQLENWQLAWELGLIKNISNYILCFELLP